MNILVSTNTPPEDKGAASGLLSDLRGSGASDLPAAGEIPGFNAAGKARPKVNLQTLVTALIIVASAGSLWMMRKQGTAAGVEFKNVKLDPAIVKTTPISPKQQKILAELARTGTPEISEERLPKNPFKLDVPAAAPVTTPGVAGKVEPTHDRDAEIKTALATVEVNAVMDGPVPVARINGELVRVGDTVAEIFMVGQIHDRSVSLIVDNKTFNVSMGDARTPGAPRPAPGQSKPPSGFPFAPSSPRR